MKVFETNWERVQFVDWARKQYPGWSTRPEVYEKSRIEWEKLKKQMERQYHEYV